MSFQSRELNVRLFNGEGEVLQAQRICEACDTTANPPKPNCPAPSKPQCPPPSKPPKGPKKRAELEALDLALLRDQLRAATRSSVLRTSEQ